MKIVVYAICKNESQFVHRWMDSMGEADQIVVLDTGSSDDTVQRLQDRGAQVTVEPISPWRFDTARNRSLELVPQDADICVCTDLDEQFHPGWRQALEKAWRPGTGQASYRYIWSFQADGQEGVVFWIEKAHARHGYQWVHPVHEVLKWVGEGSPGPMVAAEGMQLDHHPDHTKSRGQYLPLLEMSVAEDPSDDRNMHYLGREYLYKKRWDDCIRTLLHHLSMPSATWQDERAASMRYIACSFSMKGERELARNWISRLLPRHPTCGSHISTLLSIFMKTGAGMESFTLPNVLWILSIVPEPTSVKPPLGGAFPMTCGPWPIIILTVHSLPWRKKEKHWIWNQATPAFKKRSSFSEDRWCVPILLTAEQKSFPLGGNFLPFTEILYSFQTVPLKL